jgi:AcrR family transcriptional regulator
MAMAVTGRPREFDREKALDQAMLVFWRKGFLAASMNDLCEAMGIRSPSLYAAFTSKEALYLEAVDRYVDTVGARIWACLAEASSAKKGIHDLLLAAARGPQTFGAPSSCMVTLAALGEEYSNAVVEATRKIRLQCLESLRDRLKTAVIADELPATIDIDRLSRFYLGAFQGIAIQARDGATVDELEGIADTAMAAWPGS